MDNAALMPALPKLKLALQGSEIKLKRGSSEVYNYNKLMFAAILQVLFFLKGVSHFILYITCLHCQK